MREVVFIGFMFVCGSCLFSNESEPVVFLSVIYICVCVCVFVFLQTVCSRPEGVEPEVGLFVCVSCLGGVTVNV